MDVEKQWTGFDRNSKLENSPALTEEETILNDKLKLELKKKFDNVEKTFSIPVKDKQPKKVAKKKKMPRAKRVLLVAMMFFSILDLILVTVVFGFLSESVLKNMMKKETWTL